MTEIERNPNVYLNIPADGLEYAVITDFEVSADEYRENIRKYLKVYLDNTPVGTVLFNVFYRRSVVDSDCVDSMYYNIKLDENLSPFSDENGKPVKTVSPESDNPFTKGYRYTIKRGIDVIGMAIEEAKKYGARVLLSVRMDDHHDIQDPGLNSSFSYDNMVRTSIDADGERLDYCREEVRSYYGRYIIELCKNYDIDGIEFDYLRTCPIMSVVNEETTATLTGYMRSLKEEADKIEGKNIRFTARIYPDEKTNLNFGIDAVTWVAEGIVDTIVPEGWYIPTYYGIDIGEWKNRIDSKNVNNYPYCVIPGTDWAVRCDSTDFSGYIMWITLEQFKGFASSMYQKGADGIYIFNHFFTDNDMGSNTYYLDKYGTKICKNVLREKLICTGSAELSEIGTRVYVNTCPEYRNDLYPINVTNNSPYTVVINTGTAPQKGSYKVVVGVDDKNTENNNLKVFINGTLTSQIDDVSPENGFVWKVSESFEPVASHVSETCPRVMQFSLEDISCIKSGENVIQIEVMENSQKIKWLEVHVEETL